MAIGNERTKTIPEIRGMEPSPRSRTRAYSPTSYTAQYGIDVEDAEQLVEQHGEEGHQEIVKDILRMLRDDADLKARAFMREGEMALTEEEERVVTATLAKRGLGGLGKEL